YVAGQTGGERRICRLFQNAARTSGPRDCGAVVDTYLRTTVFRGATRGRGQQRLSRLGAAADRATGHRLKKYHPTNPTRRRTSRITGSAITRARAAPDESMRSTST